MERVPVKAAARMSQRSLVMVTAGIKELAI